MQNTRLRRHQELLSVRLARMPDHSLCREHVRQTIVNVSLPSQVQELRHTPAFRMDQELGTPVLVKLLVHDLGCNARVHMTLARPDLHSSSRLILDIRSEEHVREKQNLTVPWNTIHNPDRVARRANIITLSLHLGSRIDVRHHSRAWMIPLPDH